ncbi:hypothetical protein M407DRAFT_245213, partial [Tulasnella calospora MUT 4182]
MCFDNTVSVGVPSFSPSGRPTFATPLCSGRLSVFVERKLSSPPAARVEDQAVVKPGSRQDERLPKGRPHFRNISTLPVPCSLGNMLSLDLPSLPHDV